MVELGEERRVLYLGQAMPMVQARLAQGRPDGPVAVSMRVGEKMSKHKPTIIIPEFILEAFDLIAP